MGNNNTFDLIKEARDLILQTEKEKYFIEMEKKMISASISYNVQSEKIIFTLNNDYFQLLLKFVKENHLNIYVNDTEFILNDKFDFHVDFYDLIYYEVDSMKEIIKIKDINKKNIYVVMKRKDLIKE